MLSIQVQQHRLTNAQHHLASNIHSKLLKRYYDRLIVAPTTDHVQAVFASESFKALLHKLLADIPRTDLLKIKDYFEEKSKASNQRLNVLIDLARSITGAIEGLKVAGYISDRYHHSGLTWFKSERLMSTVTPKNPKIAALRETLLRFTLMAIAETFSASVFNLIDSWDGSVDYPELQTYIAPVIYVLTFLLIVGKGVFDYRVSCDARDKFATATAYEQEWQLGFDREFAFETIAAIDDMSGIIEPDVSRTQSGPAHF